MPAPSRPPLRQSLPSPPCSSPFTRISPIPRGIPQSPLRVERFATFCPRVVIRSPSHLLPAWAAGTSDSYSRGENGDLDTQSPPTRSPLCPYVRPFPPPAQAQRALSFAFTSAIPHPPASRSTPGYTFLKARQPFASRQPLSGENTTFSPQPPLPTAPAARRVRMPAPSRPTAQPKFALSFAFTFLFPISVVLPMHPRPTRPYHTAIRPVRRASEASRPSSQKASLPDLLKPLPTDLCSSRPPQAVCPDSPSP